MTTRTDTSATDNILVLIVMAAIVGYAVCMMIPIGG